MQFNSYIFLLGFFPAFFAVFWYVKKLADNSGKYKKIFKWLFVAGSVVFYVPFGVYNCLILSLSILINFLAALLLAGTGRCVVSDNRVIIDKKNKRVLFWGMLFFNVALLLFFKFSGVVFPIAISFYTFSQISCIVQLYRGEISGFCLVDYLSYILFFPKLLQGPLMEYTDFKNELEKAAIKTNPDFETILRSIYLFSMGLFKKVILADTFGAAVNLGYEDITALGSLEAIIIAVCYSFQLYFDFSGYCDMAIAVGRLMDFAVPVNFNSPYKAVDIVDFWKRWHITLTKFLTRYVYIPLGGNRRGTIRMYVNFIVVFLVSGLWHGSGGTFIIWGEMHGILYVLTRLIGKNRISVGRAGNVNNAAEISDKKSMLGVEAGVKERFWGEKLLKTILTFCYVTIAWVFFRAATVTDALRLIERMFIGGAKPISTRISACFQLDELWYVIKMTPIMKLSFAWESCLWIFVIGSTIIIFFCKNAVEISEDCKIGVRTTVFTAILLIWSILSFGGVSTFLYMNF